MNDGDIVEIEELNLKLNSLRNCVEAIPVVKNTRRLLSLGRKEFLIWPTATSKGFFFKKFKKSDKFNEMLQEIGITKLAIYFKVKLPNMLEDKNISKTQKIFAVIKFHEKLYQIH